MDKGIFKLGAALPLVLTASAALATEAPVKSPPPPQVTTVAAPAPSYKLIKLKVIAMEMPEGKLIAENSYHTMWGCNIKAPVVTSQGGKRNFVNVINESAMFDDEMKKAGLISGGDKDSLFASDQSSMVEYALGGLITNYHQHYCLQSGDAKGDAQMAISWQVYSNVEQKVALRFSTEASLDRSYWVPNGVNTLSNDLFRQNVRQLLDNPEFRKLLSGAPLADNSRLPAPSDVPAQSMTLPSLAHDMAQVRRATTLIQAGEASGSGVLISPDGYVLTAAHVVGALPRVKLRWFNGATEEGAVVAINKARDVALVKTAPRDGALALQTAMPTAGTPAYAVGSPLGDKFQGSVTKGVISGTPVLNGYRYLQSDVAVNPGNSGGPLVDDNGRILGVAVIKVANMQISGLNLFVPASDAIAWLGIRAK